MRLYGFFYVFFFIHISLVLVMLASLPDRSMQAGGRRASGGMKGGQSVIRDLNNSRGGNNRPVKGQRDNNSPLWIKKCKEILLKDI